MVRKIKKPGASQGGQQDIIRQAQQMQQEMLKIQEELKDKTVETSVGGGAVTIKANGQKQILEMYLYYLQLMQVQKLVKLLGSL